MQAIRRPLALLGLIATLAGPLLRQAEASDDLTRSLRAQTDRDAIKPTDPGVGDDPELATFKAGAFPTAPPAAPTAPGLDGLSLTIPPTGPSSLRINLARPDRNRAAHPPASARPRQARLQIFLF